LQAARHDADPAAAAERAAKMAAILGFNVVRGGGCIAVHRLRYIVSPRCRHRI